MKNIKYLIYVSLIAFAASSCHKTTAPVPVDTGKKDTVPVVTKVDDPDPQRSQGFFLDSWKPRTLIVPAFTDVSKLPDADADVQVTINPLSVETKVSPLLFGNNINVYMTQVVTEPVLLKNIVYLAPNILRMPGGSLSDLYFWNMEAGKHPADIPDKVLDFNGNLIDTTTYWSGRNNGSWTLSVDNYYNVLQAASSTGMIVVNYAYARYGTGPNPVQAAAHLAANWVRYDHGRTRYWEIGNENYGIWEPGYIIDTKQNKDGQPRVLTGALYGKHFRIFADSMRKAAAEVRSDIKIGAVMAPSANVSGVAIPNWNNDVVANLNGSADFYSLHSYYTPYNQDSDAQAILNTAYKVTSDLIEDLNPAIKSATRPIALTEWNIQAMGRKQIVSNIAGLHAALTLGNLIHYGYGSAMRWDLVNAWQGGNDMGMFNDGGEPGAAKWMPRPSFYYMYYFQKCFGDRMVSGKTLGDITTFASSFSSGQVGTVLINRSDQDHVAEIKVENFKPGLRYYYYTVNGGSDAVFSRKIYVNGIGPAGESGGPLNYTVINPLSAYVSKGIKVKVPAYGAVFLTIDGTY